MRYPKRVLKTALLVIALVIAVYLGDYASLKLQFPARPQFGMVHLQPYVAVPRKDGKTEYMLDEATDEPCVNSLFPHFGDQPCWYLKRQANKRENL